MKKLLFASMTLLFLCTSSGATGDRALSRGSAATEGSREAAVLVSSDTARRVVDNKKAVKTLIRDAVNQILEVLKDKELQQDARKEKVIEVIEPLLDMPLMAKLTLGRKHWSRLDEEQRKKFTDLFVEHLKTSYFEKLDLFADETVEFEKPVPKKKKFYMLTYIVGKDQRIEMAYKLYRSRQGWKVYDIEIEGVSIVKSYGSQYKEFLADNTFEDLLERLREKVQNARNESKGK